MRFTRLLIVAMGFCMLICKPSFPQDDKTGINKVVNFPSSFANKVNQQSEKPEARLTKQTEKYQQLTNKINTKTGKPDGVLREAYLPVIHSLKTSLSFLQLNGAKEIQFKVKDAPGQGFFLPMPGRIMCLMLLEQEKKTEVQET